MQPLKAEEDDTFVTSHFSDFHNLWPYLLSYITVMMMICIVCCILPSRMWKYNSSSYLTHHICPLCVLIPLLSSLFSNCVPHVCLPPFHPQLSVCVVSMWGNQNHLCSLCHLLQSHCQVLLVPVTSLWFPVKRLKMRLSQQVGNKSMKQVVDWSYVLIGLYYICRCTKSHFHSINVLMREI